MGCVPDHAWRASRSTLPMKRFARVGATEVPLATPFLAANSKVFSWRTCSSISQHVFEKVCLGSRWVGGYGLLEGEGNSYTLGNRWI